MDIFQSFSITNQGLILLAAFIIGLAKAGLRGIELLNVTIMALVFGSKASTGIVLPMLCFADILAVIYYKRNVSWPLFWKLIIWMAIGIIIGVMIGNDFDDSIFKKMFAFIILVIVAMMIFLETRKTEFAPKSILFQPIIGLVAGITTMIGNLAGPFSNIFFMAQRIPKDIFIGTAAWVFLVINFFKFPFQIIFWNNINISTLSLNLLMIPSTMLGFFIGRKIVSKIKDQSYRKVVIAMTIAGAIMIFMR
jgi:uncharacterized membrane protein YfcA